MNSRYFNLVSTRSQDGDHVALQRWYNDHIAILWRCDSLQSATLLRRESSEGNEADYICCYGFPDEAGFLSYEHGPARAAAGQVIQTGWGREGIAITERRQYRRLWQRRTDPGTPLPARHGVARFDLGAGPSDEISRWLADQLHVLFTDHGVLAATLMQAAAGGDAGGEVLLFLQTQGELPPWRDWLAGRPAAWGQAPASVTPRWFWQGRPAMHWVR